jgi:hypothetical protein
MWVGLLVIVCLAGRAHGARSDGAALNDRISKLEKEIADLKLDVGAGNTERHSLWSSLDIELYGFVKADASFDDSRTTPGNYVLYVDSEAPRDDDDEFNLTANQTRMGFNISGPSGDTMKTSGKIEFDFYGNYASENKPKLQIRHAYMTLDWPDADFSVLAGQTWDVISPLNPGTLNYSVLWEGGNIGYRRPQIRATKSLALAEDVTLKVEGALVRTIGRTDPTGSETGEDAGFPTLQGRVSVTFPFFGPKPTVVGVSAHTGEEEYDLVAGGDVEFDSRSVNLDVTQPVNEWLTVKGELFSGKNLNTYLGGIGQGVNTTTLNEIDGEGGWAAASLGPWSQWRFNVGAGIDSADRNDLSTGGRTRNSCVFGNVCYAVNAHTTVGLELSQWDTNYKGPGDADDMRVQASFIYKF